MRGKNRVGNERGVVLIVALMLLLVLTIIGISSISTTSFDNIISGNERLSSTAFYASEAGIQVGLNQIPDTTAISKSTIGADTSYRGGGDSGGVKFVGWAQNVGNDTNWSFKRFQVNATGESLGASKEIEVQARYGPFPSGTGYNN
jgi:Tfp pilus assembly protein PilX